MFHGMETKHDHRFPSGEAREREQGIESGRGRRPAGVARKGVTNKEPGTTLGKTTETLRRRRRRPFLHKVAEDEGGGMCGFTAG